MTDDDVLVVERLRERLAAYEPGIPAHAAAIRARGRRKLRLRRLLEIGAAAAAVAAVAVGGALTAGTSGDARPTPPVDHPDEFDPDSLTSAIDRAVHAHGTLWEERRLEARDDSPRPLKGPSRAFAHTWSASYTAGDGHALEVWLVYEKPFDEAAVGDQCAADARFQDRCEVLASTSGSITGLVEQETFDDHGNWTWLEDGHANLVGMIPVAERWYMRTVKDFRSDGLIVVAREIVHAPTPTQAAPLWLEDTDSLTAIATDPDLWFPPFPGALEQGDRPDTLAEDRGDALDQLAAEAEAQVEALAASMPCDPSEGFPEPREGCPDPDPEIAWLTADGQRLTLQPIHSYTNDAEGEAYAQAHGLDYPYSNDTLDVAEGSPHPLELSPDTLCTGSIVVSHGVGDRYVDCDKLVAAARPRQLTVAVWREDGVAVQVSELYRP